MVRNAIAIFLRQEARRRWAVVGVVVGLLLVMFPKLLYVPVADEVCQKYFKTSLAEAGISYLTCRGIIGGLDLIEHCQVSMEPWGIGLDEEPARLTDPLRDVAERASEVLFTSILVLTGEKIGYDIVRVFGGVLIGIVMLITALAALSPQVGHRTAMMGVRIMLLLLVFRVALPVSAGVCAEVNHRIFSPKLNSAHAAIEKELPDGNIKALSDWSLPKAKFHWTSPGGFLGAYLGYVWDKLSAISDSTRAITLHMGSLAEDLTSLSGLYVAKIFFQTIVIPLGVYWLLLKLCQSMFNPQLQPAPKVKIPQPEGGQTIDKPKIGA